MLVLQLCIRQRKFPKEIKHGGQALDGKADLDGDGYIVFTELAAYLTTRASNQFQTPAPVDLPGHGKGQFIFKSPTGPARSPMPAAIPKGVIRGAGESTLQIDQLENLTPEQRDALERAAKEREDALAKNKELNDTFNAGMQALHARQYDAAIISLTKASETDPKRSVIWANLADAYTESAAQKIGAGQQTAIDKGIEAYSKAIELKPDNARLSQQLRAGPGQSQKDSRGSGGVGQGRGTRSGQRGPLLL